MMAGDADHRALERDLLHLLEGRFPGIGVEVAHSARWGRMSVTFRWSGFADLLPEERFHRLVTALPAQVREQRLLGFVWLELSPKETVEQFLKLPRSEDMADREAAVYAGLKKAHFFEELAMALGASPEAKCPGNFSRSAAILSRNHYSPAKLRDAKLAFIRRGAYCDCQALLTAQQLLAELYTGAA